MKSGSPIVLLSDFGLKDPYVGVMKGVLLGISPDSQMIDLSHHVLPQDIAAGARILRDHQDYFPTKSIFLAVVDPGVGTSRKAIAIKTREYYFVGPDNGLFWPIFESKKDVVVRELTNKKYWLTKEPSGTFHGRDIFAPVAAHLSKSLKVFDSLGPIQNKIKRIRFPKIEKKKRAVAGEIIYFDSFGNAVTNIKEDDFVLRKNSCFQVGRHSIKKLSKNYGKGKELVALINSSGYLEFSVFSESSQKKAKLYIGQKVTVKS